MSVLDHPRLYFRGEISWDPGLANNMAGLFDPEAVEVKLPDGVTIGQLKGFIAANVNELRIWNFYGTHDAAFEKVTITGATAGDGSFVESDPIIGRQMVLRGKLVDLDAATVNGSQIFFDSIAIGDGTVGVRAKRSKRLHGRWLNFGRNLTNLLPIAGSAGASWQTCVAKDGLNFSGADISPLLKLFREGLDNGAAGLMIRFHTYRTLYFQNGIKNSISPAPRTSIELQQEYVQGNNFSNPAYSIVVGSIGLWSGGEPSGVPGGRLLLPRDSTQADAFFVGNDGQASLQPRPATLGPAVVELDEVRRRLSLDLGATIPERSPDLTKADVGTLQLEVAHDGNVTVLATLPPAAYDRTRYEAQAGIVDVDLPQDANVLNAIKSGRLQLRTATSGIHLLDEAVQFAAVEDRDIYIDQGEVKTLPVRVFDQGRPAPAGHQVLASAYDRQRRFVRQIGTLTVGADGTASFELRAERAEIVSYVFVPFPAGAAVPTPAERLDSIAHAYINVRTLPFDDNLAQSTPDENLRWSFIYEQILRVYDIINPVMARAAISKPLDDRQRMMNLASAIKRVIAKASFESFQHMPITRDMSAGRRKLLERWCELVLDGDAPEDAPELAALMAAARKLEMPDATARAGMPTNLLSDLLGNTSDFRMGRI